MEAELKQQPGIVILRLAGDLRLHGHSEPQYKLMRLRSAALEQQKGILILNLGAVTKLDSLGLAELSLFPIDCGKRHVDLKLVMPSGGLRETLKQLRIFEAWPIFEDETAALRSAET